MNIPKLTIWAAALIGLSPALLLAVVNLASNLALRRHLKAEIAFEHDDGSDAYFTQSFLKLGKTTQLELSTSWWPAVFVIAGAMILVAGLWFLIPRQTQVSVSGGFDQLPRHIEKFLNHRSPFAYLTVTPIDDEYTAISLAKDEDQLSFDFYLTNSEQIAAVLAYFRREGLEPIQDFTTDEATGDQCRHLSFPAEGTATELAAACTTILTTVFAIEDDRKLLFSSNR